MDSGIITIKYLQEYIKLKDFKPKQVKDYFLKLSEETGELGKGNSKRFETN